MKHMNYKPGWYLTYFIYCLVPVVAYIWYLLSRRGKDNEVFEVISIIKYLFIYFYLLSIKLSPFLCDYEKNYPNYARNIW